MRQRVATHRPHTATIEREEQTGTNELGEPISETVTVASDVACHYRDQSTEFVREESGERVNSPASIRFDHAVDVEEGDTVTIDGAGAPDYTLEVRGLNRETDVRRGHVTRVTAEVERA